MQASVSAGASLIAATLVVIGAGLTLRLVPLGLPGWVVKYGGSTLWGTMVYGLAATLLLGPRRRILALAIVVAVGVEFFRLVHGSGLDAFRATMAGALLLGRIFSVWNLVAYAVGIALGFALDVAYRPLTPASPSAWT